MFVEKLTIKDHITFLSKVFKIGVKNFKYKVPTKMFTTPNQAIVTFKIKEKEIKQVVKFNDNNYIIELTEKNCSKSPKLNQYKLNLYWKQFLINKFGYKYLKNLNNSEISK